ncbi:DUF4405 domain-containing protein [bacterium]|nr:DUF4405 domain-containing protein [bacterium]
MKKTDWKYVVDIFMFICMVGIVSIGFLMGLFLAEGPTAQESKKYFLGLHRHQWGNIHFYLAAAFVTFLILHLILEWSWIKGKSQNIFRKGWGVALVLLVVLSFGVLVLFWSLYPKYPSTYSDYGQGRGARAKQESFQSAGYSLPQENRLQDKSQKTFVVTGQMTLSELERTTGLSAEKILSRMGLPANVPQKESLGRLRKKHGFSLVEMRKAINDLLKEKTSKPQPSEKVKGKEIHEEKEEKKEQSSTATSTQRKETHPEEQEERIIRGRMSSDQSGILITGRMTLRDIQEKTGISSRKIAEKLNLPSHISSGETLGRLRKQYLFTMQEVRDVVAELMQQKNKEK